MTKFSPRFEALSQTADKQLFFIGGAPRSGTTWLQQILDSHPDICCRGEGLFMKHLAEPIDSVFAQRAAILEKKNVDLFRHTGGYPVPTTEDREFLIATAILLALNSQLGQGPVRAVGEKTPENVFFFPRLKAMFPRAKFIGMARDPRDVLTSAWHFFRSSGSGDTSDAARHAFITQALPSINNGARAMLGLLDHYPGDCIVVIYKKLHQQPVENVARLFRFLGVSDSADIVATAVAQTTFEKMSGGRPRGSEQRGAFMRKGVAGDWTTTLTPEDNALVLDHLGWMFPHFGWTP